MKMGTYNSSLGDISIATLDDKLCCVEFGPISLIQKRFGINAETKHTDEPNSSIVKEVLSTIDTNVSYLGPIYFGDATKFQMDVWSRVARIPPGEVYTYKLISELVGKPTAIRAVASACAANPYAVIIPCHRVVRTDGKPSGYRWGLEIKNKLLRRESKEGKTLVVKEFIYDSTNESLKIYTKF